MTDHRRRFGAAFSRLRPWHVGLVAVLLASAVLRLVWVRDMEYKADEVYMAERTQAVGVSESWPWLGMPSGVELRNPGLSVWVYLLPGKLFGGDTDPTVLARIPQILSLASLFYLVYLALRRVEESEREAWLWGIALAAVNPICLWLHRKIWAQSVLAPFSVLLLAGWWERRNPWGAFLWGLIGATIGQVHMSGFFYAAGFVLWTLLFDRHKVRWAAWLGGSVLGVLPMLPWLAYLLTAPRSDYPSQTDWINRVTPQFWWFWLTDVLGAGIWDPLLEHFWDYLRYPILRGVPTHLVGAAYGVAIVTGVLIYLRAAVRAWRGWRSGQSNEPEPSTRLSIGAALVAFGLLLTLTGSLIHRHYLLVAFPLAFVWLARLALGPTDQRQLGRALLLTLCLAQLALSIGFLWYIHVNQGAPQGNYGTAYGAQTLD